MVDQLDKAMVPERFDQGVGELQSVYVGAMSEFGKVKSREVRHVV